MKTRINRETAEECEAMEIVTGFPISSDESDDSVILAYGRALALGILAILCLTVIAVSFTWGGAFLFQLSNWWAAL